MGNFEILSLSDSAKWNEYMLRLPQDQRDIYSTPEYYSLYEGRGEGVAQCFVFENSKGLALYPFLKNSVNSLGYKLDKEYSDIQGAYGYNGVVASYTEDAFLDDLSQVFTLWCEQNNIIAEFERFNPLLNNHIKSKWITPIDLLDNISINLTNYEDIWQKSFHRKVREAIRKAQRYGLTYLSFSGGDISDEFLNHFLEIYNHMLQRNGADSSYFYSLEYFKQIKTLLPNNTLFTFALFNDTPISTELIIHNSVNAYAFLGGTLSDFFDKSPNTFIRSEILKDLLSKGLLCCNIGGGISRNDSLYLYKKSFSINTSSIFYIGKKIHNTEVYREVVNQWEHKFPEKREKFQSRLLKYRY